jgi:hypothetical protein
VVNLEMLTYKGKKNVLAKEKERGRERERERD